MSGSGPLVEVVKPGLCSTFQDLGRTGRQHLGVPVAGAMDEVAHRVANLLVGNDEGEATLEITLIGPTLRFHRAAQVAICGGDLGAELVVAGHAAAPVASWLPLDVPAGAALRFGPRRAGLRAAIALRGGFDLPAVMGSRSTHLRGALGGLDGRALRAGDVLGAGGRVARPPVVVDAEVGRCLWRVLPPEPGAIRVMPGREWHRFTPASQAAWLEQAWRIGPQSDRMALRLDAPSGAPLARADADELLSEAVAFGSVQVPADGRPIVLMADRQSTGGYPRIAQVASVDLPRLAQRMPGEWLRFEAVTVDQAQRLLLRHAARLDDLRAALTNRKD